MNTTPRTPQTRTRGALAIGVALTGILLLAGCTTDEPGPTKNPSSSSTHSEIPTPTPTKAAPPASEEEALDASRAAIDTYLKVRGEVNAAGGTDTAPLDAVATGPALVIAQQDAGRIVADKNKTSGTLKFEFQTGYATDLTAQDGTAYPFSNTEITGCQDGNDYKILNADGTPAQRPTNLRNVLIFNAIWSPTAEQWLVQNVQDGGATC